MKMRTCLAVILAVGLLVGAFASHGYATCELTLKIVAVRTYDDSTHYVFGIDMYQVLPGYYYFAYISNADWEMVTAANEAASSGRIAQIRANMTSCPTTGTARYMGVIDRIIILR